MDAMLLYECSPSREVFSLIHRIGGSGLNDGWAVQSKLDEGTNQIQRVVIGKRLFS